MSDHPTTSTSEPIYNAALKVGGVVSALLALIGTAVQLGVLSDEQGAAFTTAGQSLLSALPELGGAVTLVVSIVTGLVASFATAWSARKQTVPVDSDAYRVTPSPVGDGLRSTSGGTFPG